METSLGLKLKGEFAKLKTAWPDCKLDEVNGVDLYYTDGMSTGAIFKVLFYQSGLYITTVYIKDDGTFYSTMSNILIKNIVIKWIETVK